MVTKPSKSITQPHVSNIKKPRTEHGSGILDRDGVTLRITRRGMTFPKYSLLRFKAVFLIPLLLDNTTLGKPSTRRLIRCRVSSGIAVDATLT